MKVEIWSDVVCPWCFVGKRRFEQALEQFEHAGDVEVVWRSFQLDPGAAPAGGLTASENLARKYGMSVAQAAARHAQMEELGRREGLDFHFDRARPGNTTDAHRLIQAAREQGRADAVEERLMRGYFAEGMDLADREVLARAAEEAGLTGARAAFTEDRFAEAVQADLARAAALGLHGVPAFVIGGKYLVSGAQHPDRILEALRRAWADDEARAPAVP